MQRSTPPPDAANRVVRCWHWCQTQGSDVEQSIAEAIKRGRGNGKQPATANEMMARFAEFRALVSAGQRGELRAREWDRVRRQPDLWELRWSWSGLQVRGYFHEPAGRWGTETILAHVPVKQVAKIRDAAGLQRERAAQDAEIDTAYRRIVTERTVVWGLPGSRPIVNPSHN